VKHATELFFLLLAIWLLNSGHYTPLLIAFGIVSCGFVVFLARRMDILDDEGAPAHLLPRLPSYLPWLVKEILVSNIDVAKRVLAPGRPRISPLLVEAPTSQHSDLGRVVYANSITLTPGTVSIRVHGTFITVHALADEVAEDLLAGEMDRRVTRFEGIGG
jgi:multicomponent Na+:H+ antiporter subunit E